MPEPFDIDPEETQPTAVVVVSVFPTGIPQTVAISIHTAGPARINNKETMQVLRSALASLESGQLTAEWIPAEIGGANPSRSSEA